MHHLPRLLPLLAAAALVAGCGSSSPPARAAATTTTAASAPAPVDPAALDRLERSAGARIGVLALDTGSGRTVAHRAGERFAFASTGKALLAGLVLREATPRQLEEVVRFDRSTVDAAGYAPVTARHVADGMTVRALLDAALRFSDNAAANLLVRRLGGPAGEERRLRALGDATTRVDRTEPALNSAVPGDPRDTTTPRAMVAGLRRFVLGGALTRPRRLLLQRLMLRSTTGGPLIRSAVPGTWAVADKSGSGERGTRNDVAVLWPPHRRPIVLAVFTTVGREGATADDALVAAAARAAVDALG